MTTFAQKVREVIKEKLFGRDFSHQDVALHLDLVTDKDKQPLYATMREFRKRGEIIPVRPGIFRYAAAIQIRPADIQRKMWSLLRSMRTVTVADMVALAGAAPNYAKEYFQLLTRQGIVRRIDDPARQKPSKWQMIADPIKMPRNEDKAARLQAIRAAKKRAMQELDQAAKSMVGATAALARLKTALGEMPEEDDE